MSFYQFISALLLLKSILYNLKHANYPGLVILHEIRKITNVPVVLFSFYYMNEELHEYTRDAENMSYCNKCHHFLSEFVEYIHTIVLKG